MLNFMLKLLPELVQDCKSVFHLASSFSRMACLHTWQSWLKTGLLASAVNSLVKMNGLQTTDLNPLDYRVWRAMLERYKSFQPKPKNIDELEKVLQGTSCHKTLSTKPY